LNTGQPLKAVAKDYHISLSGVQKQFERFEEAGILVSKLVGKSRVYLFNKKSPTLRPFVELVKVYYDGLSLQDKEKIFASRRPPQTWQAFNEKRAETWQ